MIINDFNDLVRYDKQWLTVFPNNNVRHLVGRMLTKDPAHRVNSLDALALILRDPDDTWSVRFEIDFLQVRGFKYNSLREFVVGLCKVVIKKDDVKNIMHSPIYGVRELRRCFLLEGDHFDLAEFEDDFRHVVAEIEKFTWSTCKKFLEHFKPDE